MKLYNYKIIIEECEEGGFYAECPAFPGCHVEGETYEETIKEIKEAVKNFIEDYQSRNEELPSDNFLVTSVQIAV
ncbi:MAG: type II toxin-antitoxin system HicB family antitoxin [Bacteroidetes bacterium]|nr:type II toxin-antitoxin system HicB family antitoxin [Bacteroidota bacterium]